MTGRERMPEPTEPIQDLGALYEGAARLGLLLGAVEVPWERVVPFVSAFPGELQAYQELSVDAAASVVGVMTRGSGKDFAFRVAHFMEELGIGEVALRRFLVRSRFFEHRSLFFKIEADPSGITETAYYFRRRPDLSVARSWLADAGVDEAGWALVDQCARALDKRTVHFLAAAERPDGHSAHKVYFSQPTEPAGVVRDRVWQAARCAGLSDADLVTLAAHEHAWIGHTLFWSLTFRDGAPVPGGKLDVRDVDPATVVAVLGPGSGLDRIETLRSLFGKSRLDYVGFRFAPGRPVELRAYAYAQQPIA